MTNHVRLAGAAQGFNWLPVFVADEQGMFARRGLEVEYLRLGSVDKATAAIRDGLADVAITPPEGAVVDFLNGGGLRIIGSNSERLPMSMIARSGIAELAGLRGARIGTSSLTEGTAIYTKKMLADIGLRYPDDYDFVLAGVHTSRWAALLSGEVDAAPQPAPWNFLAEREGFVNLGEVSDALPEIVFAAVVADEQWISSHLETVENLIAALSEAHAFVNDPANNDEVLGVYQRITTPDEPLLAQRGLTYTRDLGMWPAGLRVSPAAFSTTLDSMVRADLLDPADSERVAGVIDVRFTGSTRK